MTRSSIIGWLQGTVWMCVAALAAGAAGAAEAEAEAARILQAAGVKGGLVVHLGCGDGALTAALRPSDSYIVQGLDREAADVAKTRARVRSLGLLGPVSATAFDGERLPYADNLVNLLVVSEAYGVSRDEMLRVLAPGGAACVPQDGRWQAIAKPRPDAMDEWTHYLHGPDNNAVAHDAAVGPPRRLQWLGSPRWTRNHHKLCSISSAVTANGRLFYIVDRATAANMSVPGKWCLVARDAFSGVTLWRKPMKSWAWHRIRFRSGPPQITRLLIASGDRVYAPLGLNQPVSVMDAVTGKTLRTYEETSRAEEMVLADGILLVLRGAPVAEHAAGHVAFRGKYEFPSRKRLAAVRAATGERLWTWSAPQGRVMPETLAAADGRAYVQVNEGVACLDLKTGDVLWTSGQPQKGGRKKRMTYGRYTLVVADGVVLCKLSGRLTALSAEDGKKLWECKAGGGFHAPLDIFVIDGLVWQGLHVSDSVAPPPVHDFSEGRDLRTGEVKTRNQILVDLQTSGHHHRCYREKATDRYIITGKRGIELMDLEGDDHSRNNWVRGACQYGILPANGLLYAPPHACGCYMEAKLWGFYALAPAEEGRGTGDEGRVKEASRIERGPAFGASPDTRRLTGDPSASWPQFRHDALRSGVASTAVPAKVERAWAAGVGGRLSQPVVAGGKVLVASVDEGAVVALDTQSGEKAWEYVAGGRVDSPPVVHGGRVLFGSADGWVYCLRLSDGALVWRFLAAPADVRAVALDRVESVWPAHGSVLVLDGVAYCSAGRSTWLDGGIDLYGLDPATGKVLHRHHFESEHPEFREGKDKAKKEHKTRVAQNTTDYKTFLGSDRSDSFSMAAGAVSDVLVSDGTNVFLHHVKFSPALDRQDEMTRHLFSTSSLLDDAENHRSHWVLGTGDFSRVPVAYSWVVNRPGRRRPTIAVPTGVMMVYTDRAIWGVQRKGDANGRYHLFQKDNKPFSADEKPLPDFRRIPRKQVNQCVWKKDLPVRATAIVKAGDHLFLGAMPVAIPKDDPHAAYEGRLGGMIWVVSPTDGSKVAAYKLDSPVVWDGLAAAHGALFASTEKGEVQCWRGATE
ncbi:MAG: PQQ-binding-like beta-propeller repeat protein [Planctomycetota bacterium]